ncbi:MAG TPA: methylenetetrahydrofolate reductase [NAD(P)H] [Taishania sp.]|nr:methylenetetrahydrofolate reductase [NAD(P)H] [Taishania sp.]
MKVIDKLANRGNNTLFSVEILPPLKGSNLQTIFENIDPLLKFDPSFINVTYQREEFVYKDAGNGLLKKQVVKKRPGTVGICAAIQNKYGIDTVPHILCGGFTKEETENLLIDLDFLGIENVLALRGDAIKSEHYFKPEVEGHAYASELVKQVSELNQGKYLDDELENTSSTKFCIGAACYPEKHMESPSLEQDLYYLKKKVENGADYLVTQMFFDNQSFFEFEKKCRAYGINVPIIPGLKPISVQKHLNLIPHRFHVDLPDDLVKAVMKCKNNDQVKEVGVEWCIQQSKELKEAGVPMLHYYSMGKGDLIERIAAQVW